MAQTQFKPLFDVPVGDLTKPKKKSASRQKKDSERGCKFCSLNKVNGIQKIKGEIKGKSVLLIAQSPGPDENKEGIELVGKAGQWLWDELALVGFKRKHVDIQNAVRCFPADATEGTYSTYLKMRNPTPDEIHCCSLYTDRALAQSKAKQILIFGQVAAKAVLKTRSLPTKKTFWSEELKARVYLLDHPSFFARGYGQGPRLTAFRKTLQNFAADYHRLHSGEEGNDSIADLSDQYAYVKKQDYRAVLNEKQALKAERIIRKYAAKKKRITIDIEYDDFDGVKRVICIGFSPKPGLSFTFFCYHKDLPRKRGDLVRAVAARICIDPTIKKAMHYGCSDATVLHDVEEIDIKGYTHDTNLSEFLRFSDLKSYGLEVIAERRFPQFSGYKQLVIPEMMQVAAEEWAKANPDKKKLPAVFRGKIDDQEKYLSRNKLYHLSNVSIETLTLYNGSDCDLTKRLEIDNRKHVPQALMSLYIDLGFLLYQMEPNGPQFDYEQHEKLELIYPFKEKILRRKICKMVGRPWKGKDAFKPGSPPQVKWALYKHFKLKFPFEGKKNTEKTTLIALAREHPFPQLILDWRSVSKVKSTYLDGYKRSADAHEGRLCTRWWATGARTGRLSSGGEKLKKESTLINLQNIKRDPQMQNMCVADQRWRKVQSAIALFVKNLGPEILEYWKAVAKEEALAKKEKRKPREVKPGRHYEEQCRLVSRKIEKWIRKNMPDLKTYLLLDYGQVEVRVAAQMANDKNLIADCMKSDIHVAVGVTMTGWDADRIKNDPVTRTLTKNVHFGILFGISKKNLFRFVSVRSPADQRDKITEEQVYEAYDRYFARYTGIAHFIQMQREFAREHGYVETMFGMIQTLNVTDDNNDEDVAIESIDLDEIDVRSSYWGNQAINGPVQGSAHQLMICALVNLVRRREKYNLLGIPPMEVHDALAFVVPVLKLNEAYVQARYLLEKESLNTVASDFPDIKWKVPIVVEVEAGLRYGTKVSIEKDTSVGDFMLAWYKKSRALNMALNSELAKVEVERKAA